MTVWMNGWIKGGPTSRRYHQAEHDSRTGLATLACSGRQVRATAGDMDLMDYRWRPPRDEHCQHPQCQREVQP